MEDKKEKRQPVPNPLEAELELARTKAQENLNLAKYHKAELENFRKRNAEVAANSYRDGVEAVVMQIIPLLDALYEGAKTVETENDRAGLELLIRKFTQTLTTLGVEEIIAENQPFDPRFHNAVAVEPAEEKPPDTVLEVWQRGYKIRDRIIRAATVKVSG